MSGVLRELGQPKVTKTIGSAATETLDSIPLAKFNGLRYFVTGKNNTNDKTKVLDLTVRKAGASVFDSVFGRIGDLPLQISTSQSAGDIIVQITNPNAFAIDVEAFRFLMS